MPANPNDPQLIGDWLADPRDDSLTRGADKVKIEPRTMRLLIRLAQTPGEVVSQEELLDSVWSGVVVGTASIYQSMSQLRKVLGDTDEPPRYIETVARKGYRLVATVTAAQKGSSTAPGVPAVGSAAPASDAADPADAARGRRQRWGWAAIAVVACLAAVLAVWRFMPREDAIAAQVSIVVLPFVDLTDGKTEQAFCDGLTEETSSWLAQVPTLRVVARSSAFSYRNREKDVRTIGRELQTSHVLEGTLRRSGNNMRITVQLVDTTTGFERWSNTFNVEVGDVLKVQEEVARAVAGNLKLRMTPESESRLASRHSANAEAQRYYLNARGAAARIDGPSNEEAIRLYYRALAADPTFALAKVWLAHAISNRRYFSQQRTDSLMAEIGPLLSDVAKTAPQLEDLYVVRGQIGIDLGDREAALRDLQHALKLDPGSRAAADALGYYYMTNAQPRDAATFFTIAAGVDPVVAPLHAYQCLTLAQLGQFDLAEPACTRARDLAPESALPFTISSEVEALRGNLVDAFKWSDAALERGSGIAPVYAQRGRWLFTLGLIDAADGVYQHALAADREATLRSSALLFMGSAIAVERGGKERLLAYIRDNGLEQTNDPGILFELTNAALLLRDFDLAQGYLERALASGKLTDEDLTSPWNCLKGNSYLLVIAQVKSGRGDAGEAARRLEQLATVLARLEADGVQTPGLFELKAQWAALHGNPDAAMAALHRAATIGWTDAWLAEHQPYFDSLRTRADFRALLAAVRAKNADTAARIRPRLAAASGPAT